MSLFYNDNRKAFGKSAYCKECTNANNRKNRLLKWEADAMTPTFPPNWTKKCTTCKDIKPREAFHLFIKARDGYMDYCIECCRAANRAYCKRNPESNRINARFQSRKRRSATRALTKQEKKEAVAKIRAIKNDPCYYCGGFSEQMHDDHYYPFSKGGSNKAINFVKACSPCNQTKYNRCGTWMLLKM